ncbi:hypothetical protein GH714_032683 [Hevea brasiliensis]|uniref:Uncharacterized protein n=1 Tax=Hevea brasiliensis TaxID=3981 RepID=A0A6A6K8Y8_HEVBR|nr:hypothetical protein GH714_032683 [Hevea brasiliensis]
MLLKDRFLFSFSKIFPGEYVARYYSYDRDMKLYKEDICGKEYWNFGDHVSYNPQEDEFEIWSRQKMCPLRCYNLLLLKKNELEFGEIEEENVIQLMDDFCITNVYENDNNGGINDPVFALYIQRFDEDGYRFSKQLTRSLPRFILKDKNDFKGRKYYD